MDSKPLGTKIRSFCEQLFTSRHVRFLEAELVRSRTEYQAIIRELKEMLAILNRAPSAQNVIRPKSSTLQIPEGGSWAEALEEHNRREEESWRISQQNSPRNESGLVDAKN